MLMFLKHFYTYVGPSPNVQKHINCLSAGHHVPLHKNYHTVK